MFRVGILGLIVIAALLALTNPGLDSHKNVIYESAAAEATDSPMLGRLAADVLEGFDVVPLTYHNYVVLSTMTLDGDTVSVGMLARVWRLDRDVTESGQ